MTSEEVVEVKYIIRDEILNDIAVKDMGTSKPHSSRY